MPLRPPSAETDARRGFLLALLGLLILTAAVFVPVLGADFVFWDDSIYVEGNPVVMQGLTPETVRWAFLNNFQFFDGLLEYYSPLTALSRLADTSLNGVNNAPGFHRTSLLLHLLNVALVAGVLRLMTRRPWASLAAAAIFALHPLVAEPVSWLSSRKDLVYGTTFLLCVLAYGFYARKPGWRGYLVLLGAFLLACMSKPMVVTLPCALLLLDFWPLNRLTLPPRWRDREWWRAAGRLLAEKAPLFLLSIGVAKLAVKSQANFSAFASLDVFPPEVRIGNVAAGYLEYLGKFFVPLDLAPLHRFVVYPNIWNTVPRVLLLVAACVLVVALARRLPWLFTGWFWFVGILLPVSGFVQIGAARIAERYMYVPVIGLAVIVVWAGLTLWERGPRWRPVLLGLYLGWLLPLAVAANLQSRVWENDHTVTARQLSLYPKSWNFIRGYCARLVNKGKDTELAWSLSDELIAAGEYVAPSWMRKADILVARGQPPAAVPFARKALEATPDDPEAHALLASVLATQGKPAEAIPHFEALERVTGTLQPVARMLYMRSFLETGQNARAEAEFRKLAEAAKTNPRAAQIVQALNQPVEMRR
jgi:hypothetical protein